MLPEREARNQYPVLVVAALGAVRKVLPHALVTASVLFDWSNGIAVNRRTRISNVERALVAADFKRVVLEKASIGEKAFAPTADVAEAPRLMLIHPRDWYLLGSQIEVGGGVRINKIGTSLPLHIIGHEQAQPSADCSCKQNTHSYSMYRCAECVSTSHCTG